ncbi:DUF1150 family protein [Pseudohalocynthiibacter aestuariivivens]|jgi:hypothetical protein|uniref:DUF1150 family protein n=1 Tax=Pseudohalocynthiibacter aestuariivivens TaxID=1591409 RepID=A0ABV5JCY5_9RHOB|nr:MULTISPECIES: DUF1150 family protein [Pseudohalocynthiibacter]MBS9717189.1 DUF1150 family protein [Pseudohalocynthiibacter aestuariivivens]MCK0103707.1 DUF1150 domain-containing protein [Pseudohalocynthiibacter sp. F2068]
MDTKFDFGPEREDRIVYVRSVDVADLPDEVQAQANGAKELFAVCNSEGEQLALVADRKLAFVLARQNDFAPVSVH